jgi:hypothetical protein
MDALRYKQSLMKSYRNLASSLPIMFGILLLINLVLTAGEDFYVGLFNGNVVGDSIIGAFAGSFSFGIPVTSYIVGGELLHEGISLVVITAFIMTWTTVGIAMLPLEAKYLGKKFAFTRNALNFVFAIVISLATILTLNIV